MTRKSSDTMKTIYDDKFIVIVPVANIAHDFYNKVISSLNS